MSFNLEHTNNFIMINGAVLRKSAINAIKQVADKGLNDKDWYYLEFSISSSKEPVHAYFSERDDLAEAMDALFDILSQ